MMKRSRSIKCSKLEGSLRPLPRSQEPLRQPGKPPPPTKPSPCKSPYASPNYMKSTSSSEGRKEQNKVSTLSRASSLKKVRTLTKAPSFKHTKIGGNRCSNVVLCENLDVQRETCSSTLKDSNFPPNLMLNTGAKEAEGTSVIEVCHYKYCSLNGHHHTPVPPLKRFLSSTRRLLKSQRELVMPKIDQKDDFLVEIDQNGFGESEDTISMDSPLRHIQDQNCSYNGGYIEVDTSTSVSLDETDCERTDMEWEEGRFCGAYLDNEGTNVAHGADSHDRDESGFKSGNHVGAYMEEFLAEKLLPYCHGEITAWQHFSDAGSMKDCEFTQPGEEQVEEQDMINEQNDIKSPLEDDATNCYANPEVKSANEQGGVFTDTINESKEADVETHDEEIEDNHAGGETGQENDGGIVMDKRQSTENTLSNIEDVEIISTMKETHQAGNNTPVEFDQNEAENDADVKDATSDGTKPIIPEPRNSEEQGHLSTVKHQSEENSVEVKESDMEEVNGTEELHAFPIIGIKMGNKKNCVFREFNPREPYFLPIEPDPEAEKVELRHQEMEERRNAEEWMLDYALQRTVNQLAPARKRKVALLVEAFEAVTPIPKWEPHLRRNNSGCGNARPIQTCR